MEIFSTRELATAIWLLIFLFGISFSAQIRNAILNLIKAFFVRQIVAVNAMALVYISSCVYLLQIAGWWDISLLKTTIYWTCSVVFISLFHIPKISEDFSYFKTTIRDTINLLVVIEFLISNYTFTMFGELIFIPAVSLLIILYEVSKTKEEFQIVEQLISFILTILGLVLIGYSIFSMYQDFENFATVQTISDFFLPPILTLLFLPFLYFAALYACYDTVFCTLSFAIKDQSLSAYAKRRSIRSFRTKVKLLQRWKRDLWMKKPQNRSDVDDTIYAVIRREELQKSPPEILFEKGWSPFLAKDFMTEFGMSADDYHRILPDLNEWTATSNYLEVGDDILPNNIAYYVDGNEFVANQLELVLNVNCPEKDEEAQSKFLEAIRVLVEKAFANAPTEERIEIELTLDQPESEVLGKKILLEKEEYPSSADGAYTYKFTISNNLDLVTA